MGDMALNLECYCGLEEADRIEVFDLAAGAVWGVGAMNGNIGIYSKVPLYVSWKFRGSLVFQPASRERRGSLILHKVPLESHYAIENP